MFSSMTRLALVAFAALSVSSQAFARDWQAELEQYRVEIQSEPTWALIGYNVYHLSKAIVTCSASGVAVGASFAADTVPLTNPLAELIANSSNTKYQTFPEDRAWTDAIAQTLRGALGGAVIAPVETAEFLLLWLAGEPEASYAALTKNYESTIATLNAVFAKQGECYMSLAKSELIRLETHSRWNKPSEPQQPQSPEVPQKP